MRKITGIGETVLDIIFKEDKPVAAIPGGSTFNALISLGRTAGKIFPETKVLMVTETGDDHIGDIVTSFMHGNGVSTEAVSRNAGTQSHLSLAFLDSDNNASYEFYKDHQSASLQEAAISPISFQKDDLVIFGSYFAINPKIRKYTKSLLGQAHDLGAVLYYDVNFRKSHMDEIPDLMPAIEENMSLSDFVRGSSEDFAYLYGTQDPEKIYNGHVRRFCQNFICTCDPDPIHVFSGERHLIFPVAGCQTVSTIGAGDSFNAGFIFSLIQKGITKDDAGKLDESQWGDAVSIASRFSANVCRSIFNYVDEDFAETLHQIIV